MFVEVSRLEKMWNVNWGDCLELWLWGPLATTVFVWNTAWRKLSCNNITDFPNRWILMFYIINSIIFANIYFFIFSRDTFPLGAVLCLSSGCYSCVPQPAPVAWMVLRTQDRGHFLIFTTPRAQTDHMTYDLHCSDLSLSSVIAGSWDRKVVKRKKLMSFSKEEWWCLCLILLRMRVN